MKLALGEWAAFIIYLLVFASLGYYLPAVKGKLICQYLLLFAGSEHEEADLTYLCRLTF